MQALSASNLLRVWERALGRTAPERALALLAAACPEMSDEELADLSVGRRDRLLFALRERTFGPHMTSLAACDACGESLELSFDVSDISDPDEPQGELPAGAADAPELSVEAEGYAAGFRLPNSGDLVAVARARDAAEGRRTLLERCVTRATRAGASVPPSELPGALVEAVESRMAESDPQADTRLKLDCPACGHHWLASFDVVAYLWSEVNAWAYRLLGEVHSLASAYGWREEDILAMSPRRRHVYLEMVGG
jgi:hypothetical protein